MAYPIIHLLIIIGIIIYSSMFDRSSSSRNKCSSSKSCNSRSIDSSSDSLIRIVVAVSTIALVIARLTVVGL